MNLNWDLVFIALPELLAGLRSDQLPLCLGLPLRPGLDAAGGSLQTQLADRVVEDDAVHGLFVVVDLVLLLLLILIAARGLLELPYNRLRLLLLVADDVRKQPPGDQGLVDPLVHLVIKLLLQPLEELVALVLRVLHEPLPFQQLLLTLPHRALAELQLLLRPYLLVLLVPLGLQRRNPLVLQCVEAFCPLFDLRNLVVNGIVSQQTVQHRVVAFGCLTDLTKLWLPRPEVVSVINLLRHINTKPPFSRIRHVALIKDIEVRPNRR